MTQADAEAVLQAQQVRKQFVGRWRPGRPRRVVRAVDGASLEVTPGHTLGIVGESGCGKSTLARLLLKLETPSQGRVLFDGADLAALDGAGMRRYRRAVQAVFQDPFSSLSPRMRVDELLAEPLLVHAIGDAAERRRRVARMIELVGLPANALQRYPHEFSGGQRQRIAIARALVLEPRVVVLDEPISALDVSIRAQILNLLHDLQQGLGVAYVFIAHDLRAVASLADTIAVMYLGEIVEVGPAAQVAGAPAHPYTQMLFAAAEMTMQGALAPRGEPPDPDAPPAGCRFHPRCPAVMDRCRTEAPAARTVRGCTVTCHLYPEKE
ncbi:MAG: ATP-binding cassette domain-containing protein [Burkholderiales bacterium]|nr:ATP-binding cassette domain-containing protein [Burkholderiales bacterium]